MAHISQLEDLGYSKNLNQNYKTILSELSAQTAKYLNPAIVIAKHNYIASSYTWLGLDKFSGQFVFYSAFDTT